MTSDGTWLIWFVVALGVANMAADQKPHKPVETRRLGGCNDAPNDFNCLRWRSPTPSAG